MNESVTYQWSEELASKAIAAYNQLSVGRTWFIALGGGLFFGAGLIVSIGDRSLIGLFLCLIALRTYLSARRLARDTARLVSDPTITVTVASESISITSDNGNRTFKWGQLTRAKESNGFLMLFAGRLLVANFPLDAFSEDQIQFIKKKIEASCKLGEERR